MISEQIINSVIEDLKKIDENGRYLYTKTKIAEKYNISRASVHNIIYFTNNKNNLKRKGYSVSNDIYLLIINDLKKLDKYGNYEYSYKEIANKYKVSSNYVYEIAKRNSLHNRNIRGTLNKLKYLIIEDLKKVDENGKYLYTKTKIAEKYGLCRNTIEIISKKYNIKRNKKEN